MKRYYTIDVSAMNEAELSPLEWMVLENIHFLCADTGWCFATKKSLADHHGISTPGYHKIRARLEADGWIKNNSKNHLKTTKKWHKQSSDHKQSSVNKVYADHKQSSDETINKVDAYPIKKELKEREEESIGENTKKSFSFSLKRDTHYDNLSDEYKHKLKAKCLVIDGNLERYENFTQSLRSKASYKYKDFSLVYMAWDKEKNYQHHKPIPEPALGADWIQVEIDNHNTLAINTKTYETKKGKKNMNTFRNQPEPEKPINNRATKMLKGITKGMG